MGQLQITFIQPERVYKGTVKNVLVRKRWYGVDKTAKTLVKKNMVHPM